MTCRPLVFAASLLLAPATLASAASTPPARPPSTMTSKEIAAHNNGLAQNDPNFIRCRREEVIGSLAKKLRVCRTNAEWTAYADQGARNAQEMYDGVGRTAPQGN